MAEFHFYAHKDDYGPLLESVHEKLGFGLIPNLAYPSPPEDRDPDFRQFIENGRPFFITGAFTTGRICSRLVSGGQDEGRYVIDLDKEGQLLKLSLPACFRRGKVLRFSSGSLFRPREYWDHKITYCVKPTAETIGAYGDIVKVLKQHLVNHKIGHHRVFVTRRVITLMEEKGAVLRYNGKWLDKFGAELVEPTSPSKHKR